MKYLKGTNGDVISEPAGGTLQIVFSVGYQDDMKDDYCDTGAKGVITYDGLDLIIGSMETIDRIASQEAKTGSPIYSVRPDCLNAYTL